MIFPKDNDILFLPIYFINNKDIYYIKLICYCGHHHNDCPGSREIKSTNKIND